MKNWKIIKLLEKHYIFSLIFLYLSIFMIWELFSCTSEIFSLLRGLIISCIILVIAKLLGYFQLFGLNKENVLKGLKLGIPVIFISLYSLILSFIYIYFIGFLKLNYVQFLIVFINIIGSGIFEEILYRGIILNILISKCKKSRLFSIVISSFLFGISHIYNFQNGFEYFNGIFSQIIYTFVMGLLLSVIYLKSKNLWSVILIHILFNCMGMIPFALFSTMDQFLLLHSINIVAFLNILVSIPYLLYFLKLYKNYNFNVYNNLIGYYISIQDNKEYKIYSNEDENISAINCLKNNNFYTERIVFKWQINSKNEHINKPINKIKNLWNSLALIQKICITIISIAVFIAIINVIEVPKPTSRKVSVINAPIHDSNILNRIVKRIEQEGVKVVVTPDSIVRVENTDIAQRMRTILIREDLIPSGLDPWNIFGRERWSITDFERNKSFQQAQQKLIVDHIKTIDGIDDVIVTITWPELRLFNSDQKPVKVNVIIISKSESDITNNQIKIKGIINLLKYSIEDLIDENIVILDQFGNILN